ncbi:hypothetical protein CLV63_10324 [Murinocardiopsis flavida]|uniref:Uncharacterized protein n=1 Tax=Murinocardiopsis flavida TaxID=645275 RepID=A0A2P8DQ07_9ACTN|nr:hypothetical protein [Murinocardiopsis flavida]PSK99303.1 hypothetical protein CLV63_10324 [Murinocardiopsis flavida]
MRNPIARYRDNRPSQLSRCRPYVTLVFTPPPPPYPVHPKAAMVRPYVLRQIPRIEKPHEDRSLRGLAVLLDIARPVAVAA